MKVLHVITGLGIGGAEQQLSLLLPHMSGVRSSVVTLTNPGPVADALRAAGVPVAHLGMRGNRDLSALPRLTRLIRHGAFDVVHTHLYRACVYGRLAAKLAGVRAVVATEHSLGAAQIEGRRLSRGARALYLASERLGTSTVAVSDTVARRLADWGVRPGRIRVVPNGIDVERFAYDPRARRAVRERLGLPPGAYVVGGVGRLAPGKRFGTLIRAVAAVPGARLLLVGEGEERERLERLARECGVADRVVWAGGVPAHGLPGLLSAMDLFVSTSADEAFGLAIVEALAAGLPVRYVACPALDDLPPGEAPGARRIGGTVADVVAALEPDTRERLPVPAAVHRYDIARSARQLMSLYDEVSCR
ncbi:glycosyltransferase [Streptomyces sp. WAC05374]|uniref:glycosyltransferase n=2 Tax=Streptomyces sp. WAC05374 TaxID=2487420 RepID=UPI0010547120|nr:glycosyltransferase [Streptomyces sp. WAC05374]TDF40089.1 glycosyltransferase [Streptomyces sp. WAC05374]TDF47937.1 glycosyltransferase [Streptomyces sp. WAC05374]TDF59719.1 glycosyltransferase [Streptomyces sp. WAC05374]